MAVTWKIACFVILSLSLATASDFACLELCVQDVDNNNQTCIPLVTSECNASSPSSSSHNPPLLTALSLEEDVLHLTWQLSSVTLAQTAGLQLVSSTAAVNETCHQVQMNSSLLATYANHKVSVHSRCTVDVQTSTVYNITLIQLPDYSGLVYRVSTPHNLSLVTDGPETWRPVVAIAAYAAGSSIEVVFQPASITASLYMVNMYDVPPHREYNLANYLNSSVGSFSTSFHVRAYLRLYQATVCLFNVTCIGLRTVTSTVFLPEMEKETTTGSPPVIQSTTPPTHSEESTAVLLDTTSETDDSSSQGMLTSLAPGGGGGSSTGRIIGGVVGGILALLVLTILIICVCRRLRCCIPDYMQNLSSDSDYAVEYPMKSSPSVLVLYSYDCQLHESVVVEFCSYLKHVFGCNVALDIWEQADIQSRGSHSWLRDKLDMCQYVLVICSAGARYKCARGRPFRLRQDRPVPDTFSLAADLIAEKMRVARLNKDRMDVIVACFEYSGPSDIPPKLDMAPRVHLMRDIHNLYTTLYNLEPSDDANKSNNNYRSCGQGLTSTTYHMTQIGSQLQTALTKASEFFRGNPDWIAGVLEPISPISHGDVTHSEGSLTNGSSSEQLRSPESNSSKMEEEWPTEDGDQVKLVKPHRSRKKSEELSLVSSVSSSPRDKPHRLKQKAITNGFGGVTDRLGTIQVGSSMDGQGLSLGPSMDMSGSLIDQPGSPVKPRVDDKTGSSEDQFWSSEEGQGTATEKQGPFLDKEVSLSDRNGPPFDRQISSSDRNGPSFDRQISSLDKNGPSLDRQVSSSDRNGPSFDRQVSSSDRNGPSFDRQVSSSDRNGPSFDRQVSSSDRNGPSFDRQVSSSDRNGPSFDRQVSSDKQGSSLDRLVLSDEDHGIHSPPPRHRSWASPKQNFFHDDPQFDEQEQLQRDIEDIHNFDSFQSWISRRTSGSQRDHTAFDNPMFYTEIPMTPTLNSTFFENPLSEVVNGDINRGEGLPNHVLHSQSSDNIVEV